MTLTLKSLQSTTCYVDGSNAFQTSSNNYGSVSLLGNGVNLQQIRQESNGGFVRGGFSDVTVTLQPNTWYRLYMQVKASGDTSDSTEPYTPTNSDAYASLTSWFEPTAPSNNLMAFGGPPATPFLESASGYGYTAPHPAAVPEPASVAAMAVGVVGLLRRTRSRTRRDLN